MTTFFVSMEETISALSGNLQKYFQDHGFERAVLGISGGVDSAVTAAIAVRALGKENVFGLIMPFSKYSSSENINDAKEVAEFLDIHHRILFIDSFAEEFFKVQWIKNAEDPKLSKANILARIRMILLYSWANELGCLVLGTCNKSETLLGYETKFGDGASDVSVLGDLWKTEVWEMAKELGLGEKYVTKSPSAELYADQTDEGELGFSYQTADSVLQKWEKNEELDVTNTTVEKVLKLIEMNEHKRNMAPIISRNP